MRDRHRPHGIVESLPAVTTYFVAMPFNRKHSTQLRVVTPKGKIQRVRERINDTIPKRSAFQRRRAFHFLHLSLQPLQVWHRYKPILCARYYSSE